MQPHQCYDENTERPVPSVCDTRRRALMPRALSTIPSTVARAFGDSRGVALRRRYPADDQWVVPHNILLAVFSPSSVNVCAFDPKHGADHARSYATKCLRPEITKRVFCVVSNIWHTRPKAKVRLEAREDPQLNSIHQCTAPLDNSQAPDNARSPSKVVLPRDRSAEPAEGLA